MNPIRAWKRRRVTAAHRDVDDLIARAMIAPYSTDEGGHVVVYRYSLPYYSARALRPTAYRVAFHRRLRYWQRRNEARTSAVRVYVRDSSNYKIVKPYADEIDRHRPSGA